jgi:hypothetical protein
VGKSKVDRWIKNRRFRENYRRLKWRHRNLEGRGHKSEWFVFEAEPFICPAECSIILGVNLRKNNFIAAGQFSNPKVRSELSKSFVKSPKNVCSISLSWRHIFIWLESSMLSGIVCASAISGSAASIPFKKNPSERNFRMMS